MRKQTLNRISELWSYGLWTYIFLWFFGDISSDILGSLIATRDDALTTANIGYVLLSPQGLAIIIVILLTIAVYMIVDLFGKIVFVGNIYRGLNKDGILKAIGAAIGKAISSFKLFLNPTGLLVLIYVFAITPIIHVGFSISLTRGFYIPKFITAVIFETRNYLIAYALLCLILSAIGIIYMFTLHGVLLYGEKPAVAMKKSRQIIGKHWKQLASKLIRLLIVLFLIQFVILFIFDFLPNFFLEQISATLPINYELNIENIFSSELILSETEQKIILVRMLALFAQLGGRFIEVVIKLICRAYFLLEFTKFFLEYNDHVYEEKYTIEDKYDVKGKFLSKIVLCILAIVGIGIASILLGHNLDGISDLEFDSNVIGHRTAGHLSNENSLEGLEVAISRGCFGAETDVQRTKDNHYIINHDDDFLRLAGVRKASKDMTLAEIRELNLIDPLGTGKPYKVATIEEFLDCIKGRIKLFIELKGVTADRKMVDDIVAIVKAKDCVKDVALISLKADVINYAEEKYPEMDTGVLFFGGVGNMQNMKADWILMEEELATKVIMSVEDAGKTAGVWTINDEPDMVRAFDYGVHGIITDEIELFENVKFTILKRTDFERIKDWVDSVFIQ